jgi:hypothetical protein
MPNRSLYCGILHKPFREEYSSAARCGKAFSLDIQRPFSYIRRAKKRVLVTYSFRDHLHYPSGLFIVVFYYSCLTTNVTFTLPGTNVGVLLQIYGLTLPPYCLFVKEILLDHNR